MVARTLDFTLSKCDKEILRIVSSGVIYLVLVLNEYSGFLC